MVRFPPVANKSTRLRATVSAHDERRLRAIAGPEMGVAASTLARELIHWGLEHFAEVKKRIGEAGEARIAACDAEHPEASFEGAEDGILGGHPQVTIVTGPSFPTETVSIR